MNVRCVEVLPHVRTARFDPPVATDVNECAAPAIYKTRLAHAGSIAIPIDFQN